MKITIVTLNYNSSRETIRLLESLKQQTDSDFETIVVDNASEKSDFFDLQAQLIHNFPLTTCDVVYPQVKMVKNSENLGFSGGNNVGIRQALQNGSEWVVLLNNDVWVENGFIGRLKTSLLGKDGIVGIPLNEGDRTAYCGKIEWLKPTLSHVYNVKETSNLQYSNFQTINYKLKTKNYYLIGGGMAIHKNVFEKIGLLDEKYFLYFEDADFSVRARNAGFDISVAKGLSIHHHVSSSTKKLGSPLLLRYHYRNALYFNLKNGPWYIKLAIWPWSLIVVIKQLDKLVINRNSTESKALLNGVFDFYKNKMGKIKTG